MSTLPWRAMLQSKQVAAVIVMLTVFSARRVDGKPCVDGQAYEDLGFNFEDGCGASCEYKTDLLWTYDDCAMACANDISCGCAFFVESAHTCRMITEQCYSMNAKMEWVPIPTKQQTAKPCRGPIGFIWTPKSGNNGVDPTPAAPQPCPSAPAVSPTPSDTPSSPSPAPQSPTGPASPTPSPDPPLGPSAGDGPFQSLSTNFEGFGTPYGGCGVPQQYLVSTNGKNLPFVALNVFKSDGTLSGMYQTGKNCGRWVRITPGNPCSDAFSDQVAVCQRNGTSGPDAYDKVPDAVANAGIDLYGYVGDSCGDDNYWCRHDTYHLDISSGYLRDGNELGMNLLEPEDTWRNRKITWEFIDGPPAGYSMDGGVKFLWAANAMRNWRALIAYNLPNGIGGIMAELADGTFQMGTQVGWLGQQWELPEVDLMGYDGMWKVRVLDHTGTSYGDYLVSKPEGVDTFTEAEFQPA